MDTRAARPCQARGLISGDTEQSIAALSLGLPTRPVELGFLVGERATALPWFEFCQHYQLMPQYVLGVWE